MGAVALIVILSAGFLLFVLNRSHIINIADIPEGIPPLPKDITPCRCQGYTLSNKEQSILNNLIVAEIYENVMTADKLQEYYDRNKDITARLYGGKKLLIVGEVKAVNKDENDIYLYGKRSQSNEPIASMAHGFKSYLDNMKKGKVIHIICSGYGTYMNSALLTECAPVDIYIKNRLKSFCKDCSEYHHGAQSTFWLARKADQVLPAKSDCYEGDIRKYKNCIVEIHSLISENTANDAENKIMKIFQEAHPNLKKVVLMDVPDSNDLVKIILQRDKTDSEYAQNFSVARYDINNDGRDDILYTNSGLAGSCGYSWSIIISKGSDEYEQSKCSISCVGKSLYFSTETFKGLKVPYDIEEKQTYDCE
jgi:hypothetical protein